MTFTDLQIRPELIAALEKQQIVDPTPIQTAALPVLLSGKDAYLHAETGTGKTLAYLLPAFMQMEVGLTATQVVIVAPTHELAIQIQRQSMELALNASLAVKTLLLIGGTSTARQIDKLKKKPHVVVGSPGRIRELITAGKLKMQHVRTVIVDEADRLMNDESLPAIRAIVQATPPTRQLIFASATVETHSMVAIESLSPQVQLLKGGMAAVNENIEHLYLVCEEREKTDELRKLLHALAPERAMVFVHRNQAAERIAAKLEHHHIPVADLTADMDKHYRKEAMDGIRSGKIAVLIASDIAARGLDIKGVTHIFNFDVPTLSKDYLHRTGRTGRAGAKGVAMTIATEIEARMVRRYQEELGISLQRVRMREGRLQRLTD